MPTIDGKLIDKSQIYRAGYKAAQKLHDFGRWPKGISVDDIFIKCIEDQTIPLVKEGNKWFEYVLFQVEHGASNFAVGNNLEFRVSTAFKEFYKNRWCVAPTQVLCVFFLLWENASEAELMKRDVYFSFQGGEWRLGVNWESWQPTLVFNIQDEKWFFREPYGCDEETTLEEIIATAKIYFTG